MDKQQVPTTTEGERLVAYFADLDRIAKEPFPSGPVNPDLIKFSLDDIDLPIDYNPFESIEAIKLLKNLTYPQGDALLNEKECANITSRRTKNELADLVKGLGCHSKKSAEYIRGIYDIYGAEVAGVFLMLSKPGLDYSTEGSVSQTLIEAEQYINGYSQKETD